MKRQGRAKVRPKRTKQDKARERLEMLKDAVSVEIGQLHKTNALLIATQFAANHECEFDASDAVAYWISTGETAARPNMQLVSRPRSRHSRRRRLFPGDEGIVVTLSA